ncbi:cytochrome P450, partial [Favolaschia claudopus]
MGGQKEEEEAETLLMNPKVLKDEVLLTFVVYFLSMYPTVFTRLRTEILDRVGNERRPTYEDIREMKYLRARPMRLYPPRTVKATTWPSMDPTKPALYIPARTKSLLDDRLKRYLLPNPYCFLPFNAGPRVCLGQQFAYNEVSFMLIRLLQTFTSTTLDLDACPPHARVPSEWHRDGKGRVAVEQ